MGNEPSFQKSTECNEIIHLCGILQINNMFSLVCMKSQHKTNCYFKKSFHNQCQKEKSIIKSEDMYILNYSNEYNVHFRPQCMEENYMYLLAIGLFFHFF